MLLTRRAFAQKGTMSVDVAAAACLLRYFLLAAVAISVVTCNAQTATQASCDAKLESLLKIGQAQGGPCGATMSPCDSTGTSSVGPCSSSESVCPSKGANMPSKCPSQECCFNMIFRSCLPDSSTYIRRLSEFSVSGGATYCDERIICQPECLNGALRPDLVNHLDTGLQMQ